MVSEIGLGTWQLGTKWGDPFNEAEAQKILEASYESGINLIDTADIYNDGNSELAIGKFIAKHKEKPPGGLGVEQLDLVLLHCPPTSVYQKDELFSGMDKLVQKGKISHYGVSIEKVSEGLQAMGYPISAIEVIFNMFRMKPLEELFPTAKTNDIGILARVPLASGLLTGRYTKDTVFGKDDHRSYNRNGEAFDKGETFSGVDYELGLQAVEELKKLFHTENLIPYALRWILMHDAVSAVIPGASKCEQVLTNVTAAELTALTPEQMAGVAAVYDKYIRESVHCNW